MSVSGFTLGGRGKNPKETGYTENSQVKATAKLERTKIYNHTPKLFSKWSGSFFHPLLAVLKVKLIDCTLILCRSAAQWLLSKPSLWLNHVK